MEQGDEGKLLAALLHACMEDPENNDDDSVRPNEGSSASPTTLTTPPLFWSLSFSLYRLRLLRLFVEGLSARLVVNGLLFFGFFVEGGFGPVNARSLVMSHFKAAFFGEEDRISCDVMSCVT